ncbi:MAG: class I SAM-dependent methyltransferase, partial [Hyphomicrobiales bacterium]|nr:class I SAM-dependent methyltransferase [Hyphomicrobiales bacterium]
MRRKLARARVGSIEVEFPSGGRLAHVGDAPGPAASLRIERMRGAWRAATRGEAGLVDGWIDGDWTTPDLTSLIEWGARQDEAFFGRALDLAPLRAWHRLRHRLRANTRRGSRANVIAHYDLGNDFYRAWLDEGMVYSSARWDRGAADLEEAQRAKLAAIVERLDLR